MRLRHIPGAEQMIEDSPYVIQNPEERKGKWHEVFGNHNPIRIEVGMGKGRENSLQLRISALCV